MVSWPRGTYQAMDPCLYCGGNHQEKEVIQCLIVIPYRVPRTGFSLPAGSAPNRAPLATTMRKGRVGNDTAFLFVKLAFWFRAPKIGKKGERMNGAESLVETLAASGIEVCFANPGTSEMHFVAALDKSPDPAGAGFVRRRGDRGRRRLWPHDGQARLDASASGTRLRQRHRQSSQCQARRHSDRQCRGRSCQLA